jgi:hypothetical protein
MKLLMYQFADVQTKNKEPNSEINNYNISQNKALANR